MYLRALLRVVRRPRRVRRAPRRHRRRIRHAAGRNARRRCATHARCARAAHTGVHVPLVARAAAPVPRREVVVVVRGRRRAAKARRNATHTHRLARRGQWAVDDAEELARLGTGTGARPLLDSDDSNAGVASSFSYERDAKQGLVSGASRTSTSALVMRSRRPSRCEATENTSSTDMSASSIASSSLTRLCRSADIWKGDTPNGRKPAYRNAERDGASNCNARYSAASGDATGFSSADRGYRGGKRRGASFTGATWARSLDTASPSIISSGGVGISTGECEACSSVSGTSAPSPGGGECEATRFVILHCTRGGGTCVS